MLTNQDKLKLYKAYGGIGGIATAATFLTTFPSAMLGTSTLSFLGLTGIGASLAISGLVGLTFAVVLPFSFWAIKKILKFARKKIAARKAANAARKKLLTDAKIIKDLPDEKPIIGAKDYKKDKKFNKKVLRKAKKYNFAVVDSSLFPGGTAGKKVICLISPKPNKKGLYKCFSPYADGNTGFVSLTESQRNDKNLVKLNVPAEEINNVLANKTIAENNKDIGSNKKLDIVNLNFSQPTQNNNKNKDDKVANDKLTPNVSKVETKKSESKEIKPEVKVETAKKIEESKNIAVPMKSEEDKLLAQLSQLKEYIKSLETSILNKNKVAKVSK